MLSQSAIAGTAAGVPFVAIPPRTLPRETAPIVIAWHLMDPPRTETAFAAALPLDGLDAWRIYLGLPMTGSRTPAGGFEEIMRLGMEDAVLNVYDPIISGAATEVPAALRDLRKQLGMRSEVIGLLGGSAGAAVAQLVMAEGDFNIAAAVLASPVIQVRSAIHMGERMFGLRYQWSERSTAIADRLDFVARAGEIAGRNDQPPTLLVIGDADDESFVQSAKDLHVALHGLYRNEDHTRLVTIAGMPHALADEPGMEPAPQNANAAEVDQLAAQ